MGAVRFLKFCTVFLCNHRHFYLITDVFVALISEFKACEKIKKMNCATDSTMVFSFGVNQMPGSAPTL
jgi:hypothetical protein